MIDVAANPSDAVEKALDLFGNDILRLAYSYMKSREDAEDIVQDSVVNLIRKVATIRAMKRQVLAAYIISTVRNTSINRLKAIEYEREHVVEDSDIELESISTEDLLEARYQRFRKY